MPIIAATDTNTDIGKIAEANCYGYWCSSSDVQGFSNCVNKYSENVDSIKVMGTNGYNFLTKNYLVDNAYKAIICHSTDAK